MLYDSARPSFGQHPRRVRGLVVRPITRAPVNPVHSSANTAIVCDLPAPAAAFERHRHRPRRQHRTTASACSAVRSVPATAAAGLPPRSRAAGRCFACGDDVRLEVQVPDRAPPVLARRPVHAHPVRRPHPQRLPRRPRPAPPRPGPRPSRPGRRPPARRPRSRLGVADPRAERPVHLKPQLRHRPRRVPLLHLRDRDPGRPAASPAPSRHPARAPAAAAPAPGARCTVRCRSAAGPVRAPVQTTRLRMHRGQRPHLRRRSAPPHAASRSASVGSVPCTCPLTVRRASAFGAPRVLPGLLVQQPQRPLGRRLAVHRSHSAASRASSPVTATRTAGELLDQLRVDPADLAPVAVRTLPHRVAELPQPALQEPVRQRRQAQLLLVAASRPYRPRHLSSAPSARCTRFHSAMCT